MDEYESQIEGLKIQEAAHTERQRIAEDAAIERQRIINESCELSRREADAAAMERARMENDRMDARFATSEAGGERRLRLASIVTVAASAIGSPVDRVTFARDVVAEIERQERGE